MQKSKSANTLPVNTDEDLELQMEGRSRPRPAGKKNQKVPKPKKNKQKRKSQKLKPDSSPYDSPDEENCQFNEHELCDDDSNDDMEDEMVNVIRNAGENKPTDENCLVCGEFGRDGEKWYRCRVCAAWAHKACTDATRAKDYVCDFCS